MGAAAHDGKVRSIGCQQHDDGRARTGRRRHSRARLLLCRALEDCCRDGVLHQTQMKDTVRQHYMARADKPAAPISLLAACQLTDVAICQVLHGSLRVPVGHHIVPQTIHDAGLHDGIRLPQLSLELIQPTLLLCRRRVVAARVGCLV